MDVTQFSDLPSCLVIDILLRLPLRTLVSCMCVCKDWTRLFRDQHFIKLHLAASPIHLLNREPKEEGRLFQFEKQKKKVKVVNLLTNKVSLPHYTKIHNYASVNSCNGLLCLVDDDSYCNRSFVKSVCVCNPLLGEWVSIPIPVRNYARLGTLALVFSAKDNQYKLLHGFKTEEQDYGFAIYILGGTGTREWRSIDETLGCRPWSGLFCFQDFNTFVHGSLHWNNHTQDFICCFDVDREKFGRLSLPIPQTRFSGNSSVRLGVINGRLCAVYFHEQTEVEIWAMKEYGVEKSWVKMVNFHVCIDGATISLQIPFVLFSLNEEEIFIYCHHKGLFAYNSKINTLRHWKEVKSFCGVAYNPSFVSLQDVAKGERVTLSRTMQVIQ